METIVVTCDYPLDGWQKHETWDTRTAVSHPDYWHQVKRAHVNNSGRRNFKELGIIEVGNGLKCHRYSYEQQKVVFGKALTIAGLKTLLSQLWYLIVEDGGFKLVNQDDL